MNKESPRVEVLQGTLDLLVIKTLDTMGQLNGYAIARRIEQMSNSALSLNQGTLYPALLRLEQRGLIESEIGVSDTGRRARFYRLTKAGRKQLTTEIEQWQRVSAMVNAVIGAPSAEKLS